MQELKKTIYLNCFYYNIALLNFIKTQVMLLAINQRQYYLFKYDSMSSKYNCIEELMLILN